VFKIKFMIKLES